jgi:hypothetical protein
MHILHIPIGDKCVIVDVPNQSKPLLYSLVARDIKYKSIIPIGEFVTTSHSSNSISNKLSIIRDTLVDNYPTRNEKSYPDIVVVDFSWASIHAINKTFNYNCSILSYLEWTHEILVLNKPNHLLKIMNNTIIYLCSVHILKNIIKKAKSINVEEKVRKAFVFCFALLQNSINIENFDFILFHVFKLFNIENMNSLFFDSFNKLKIEVENHNLQKTNVNNSIFDETKELREKVNFVYPPQETVENLKKDSPFSKYYNELLCKYASHIKTTHVCSTDKKNEYFSPDLFKIIKEYLHILPLWTGCLIYRTLILYDDIKVKSRLDNNCVENNFGHIKNNLFHNNLQTPSSMSAILYDRYKLKYLLNYMKPEQEKELGNIKLLIFFYLIYSNVFNIIKKLN